LSLDNLIPEEQIYLVHLAFRFVAENIKILIKLMKVIISTLIEQVVIEIIFLILYNISSNL